MGAGLGIPMHVGWIQSLTAIATYKHSLILCFVCLIATRYMDFGPIRDAAIDSYWMFGKPLDGVAS